MNAKIIKFPDLPRTARKGVKGSVLEFNQRALLNHTIRNTLDPFEVRRNAN